MNIHVNIPPSPCQAAGLPNITNNKGQKLTKNNQDKRHIYTDLLWYKWPVPTGKYSVYAYYLETNNLSLFNTDKIT